MTHVKYIQEFYCGFCDRKVKRGEERINGYGQARCPKDGNLLRPRARGKPIAVKLYSIKRKWMLK